MPFSFIEQFRDVASKNSDYRRFVSSVATSGTLLFLGTSFVKGFAITLCIGIVVSMFSAIIVTRSFLRAFAGSRLEKIEAVAGESRQTFLGLAQLMRLRTMIVILGRGRR